MKPKKTVNKFYDSVEETMAYRNFPYEQGTRTRVMDDFSDGNSTPMLV